MTLSIRIQSSETELRINIFNRLKNIIIEKLPNVNRSQIIESSNFFTDLGADSLDATELVMGFESEFSIDISDESTKNLYTVGDVINYILKFKYNII